ncbi:MAG: 23S rRNA (pseudouridine(1915)-N(3))-methyltransferase RlmH [Planctomycetota bacterium]|nr:MAG: 23S rRNA (pseudouridine(1915)-N(3))-methyltransferase RlmH [Planctomycetota bacterium]
MRITLLQRARLRDPTISAMCEEYRKRFRRYGQLDIREENKPRWPEGAWRILADERGDCLSSEAFAQQLARWSMLHGDLCIAIGDGDGHDADFATAAQTRISLSPMVFPHRLAHLLMVEQIYRAGCILAGHPYHHGS